MLITNKQLQKEDKPSWLTEIGIIKEIFRANDMSLLTNLGNLNHKQYSEGKLKFYTSIKERPGFENLNMENPKFSENFESVHTNFK